MSPKLHRRFDELLEKHCFGTSTPVEEMKLAKLQTLRRAEHPRSARERRNDEVLHYEMSKATKALGAILHQDKRPMTEEERASVSAMVESLFS